MTALQNFAFEEHLVRIVDREGEPWFVGMDVCSALSLAKPENALGSLDEDEKYTLTEGVLGDGPGPRARIIVSEPGLYRLIFRSRKPEAERFKRWVTHEVLPAIRKTGRYGMSAGEDEAFDDPNLVLQPLAAKVGLLHFVARTRGKEAAVAYMSLLGLPDIPARPETERQGESVSLRDMLLDHEIEGVPVAAWITRAIDGEHVARQVLLGFGIKISEKPEGFWLGSGCEGVKRLFEGHAYWLSALRRLPGVVPAERQNFAGLQSRASWLPISVTDRTE